MNEDDFLSSRGWLKISNGWWASINQNGTLAKMKEGALKAEGYQRATQQNAAPRQPTVRFAPFRLRVR